MRTYRVQPPWGDAYHLFQAAPHRLASNALKSTTGAQGPQNHASQLEEANRLRLASDPRLSMLRWLSTALRSAKSYQTRSGTVGGRQEG
jgi:hypothetical protein